MWGWVVSYDCTLNIFGHIYITVGSVILWEAFINVVKTEYIIKLNKYVVTKTVDIVSAELNCPSNFSNLKLMKCSKCFSFQLKPMKSFPIQVKRKINRITTLNMFPHRVKPTYVLWLTRLHSTLTFFTPASFWNPHYAKTCLISVLPSPAEHLSAAHAR